MGRDEFARRRVRPEHVLAVVEWKAQSARFPWVAHNRREGEGSQLTSRDASRRNLASLPPSALVVHPSSMSDE
jgi:hypothetical protein